MLKILRDTGRLAAGTIIFSLLWLPHGGAVLTNGATAVGRDDGGLSESPWPKMLGNARNTGLSHGGRAAQAKPWLLETLGTDRTVGGPPALDADGTLYIGADSLYALEGNTGRKRWSLHFLNLFLCPPIIGSNGMIYVSPDVQYFCALDAGNGAIRWRFEAHAEPHHASTKGEAAVAPQNQTYGFYGAGALAADGTLYITSTNGNLYALDSRTGQEKWRFSTHQHLSSSPAIGADASIYFTSFGTLFAVDGKSGKKEWDLPGCDVRGPVAIGTDGTLYVTTFRPVGDRTKNRYACSATALNSRNGERKWDLPLGEGAAAPPAVGEDGTVYIGYQDNFQGPSNGKVVAIDGKSGLQRWKFETNGGSYLSPAIGSDGTIYIGSRGGIMYALDGATGTQVWQVDIGAEIGTPVAIGTNGLIYFGADDGTIYALRAKDGARAPRPQ